MSSPSYKAKRKRRKKRIKSEWARLGARMKILNRYKRRLGCIDCGVRHKPLEFDHVRDKKTYEIFTLVRKDPFIKLLLDELKKCDIRCTQCHKDRHSLNKALTHNEWE